MCDKETEISTENLCMTNTTQCQDRRDISFCVCGQHHWLCKDNKQCIRNIFVCDDEYDCDDGSDDERALCFNVWTCLEGYAALTVEGWFGGMYFSHKIVHLHVLPS